MASNRRASDIGEKGKYNRMAMLKFKDIQGLTWHQRKHRVIIQQVQPAPCNIHAVGVVKCRTRKTQLLNLQCTLKLGMVIALLRIWHLAYGSSRMIGATSIVKCANDPLYRALFYDTKLGSLRVSVTELRWTGKTVPLLASSTIRWRKTVPLLCSPFAYKVIGHYLYARLKCCLTFTTVF